MPTVNPRVNVTLSPSLHALVQRLAKHQRVSKSTVLREFLEAVEPGLEQVVALMDAADRVSGEVRERIARDVDHGVAATSKALDVALQKASGLTRDLLAEAEAVKGRRPARLSDRASTAPHGPTGAKGPGKRRPAGASGRKDPPVSKRGVKS